MNEHDGTARLLAAIEVDLARLDEQQQVIHAELARLDAEQAAQGHHPHYPVYLHGGIAAGADMTAAHILAQVGFFRLPWRDALGALEATGDLQGDLLPRLRAACEADAGLEVGGLAWLGEQDLLKRGGLDPFWIKRVKFGLGQPAVLHGLDVEHHDGHRGLFTLPLDSLGRGLAAASVGAADPTFGGLLLPVIAAGGELLAARGRRAVFRDAKARYGADCRAFADHQGRTNDRRWRWLPAKSRQGHLAVTTARARGVAVPAERTRGHAATWLDDHGANIRYRED